MRLFAGEPAEYLANCGNGKKESFYGDLHATGKDGVRFFTENKVEITRWLSEPGPSPAVHRPMEAGG